MGTPSRKDETHERTAPATKLAASVDGPEIGPRSVGNALGRERENRASARFSSARAQEPQGNL